jgi:hypothetical protein
MVRPGCMSTDSLSSALGIRALPLATHKVWTVVSGPARIGATTKRKQEAGALGFGLGAGEVEADDLFERLTIAADEGPAVDEKGRRAFHTKRFSFREISIYSGFCVWRGHAGVERVGGSASADSSGSDLIPGIVGSDGVLIGENGVLKFQKRRGGDIFVDAAAGERGGHGPGMDLFEREIFIDEADLRKFGLDGFHDRIHLLTVRTFEVAEFDDGELCGGGACGRRIAGGDFGAGFGEGIFGHVANFAAEHEAGVLGDVNGAVLILALVSDGDGDLEKIGNFRLGDGAEGDFVVGSPAEEDAEVSRDLGGESGVFGRGGGAALRGAVGCGLRLCECSGGNGESQDC